MPHNINLKIATLNVKGLNNRGKQTNTITLLKSYKLDIITLQETNMNSEKTIEQIKFQWGFPSIWTNKGAILAGKKDIEFTNIVTSMEGRVIEAEFRHKGQEFHITNVYAPPNLPDRTKFFERWEPSIKRGSINIITGDFNTNLNPESNRISQSAYQQDPSRKQLLELTKDFIDASEVAGESPFLTYFQNTQMGRSMATCIDYIFIEAEYSHLIKQMSLRHGNSDHMLLECTLRSAKPHESNALWRFDERCLRNDKLAKEVMEELTDKEAPNDWDSCKLRIQSIIRAFKKPKATEGKITQLNKKLLRLKKSAARQDVSSFTAQKIEEIQTALKDELGQLSETWRRKSKARWIEKGERSTKYFYARFKSRTMSSCQDRIKIPGDSEVRQEPLHYIKTFYETLYKTETPDNNAISDITKDLPHIQQEENTNLEKEISEEEIESTIRSLAYNKSPGTDGLTHEFYRLLIDKVTPVLKTVFNRVMRTGVMPISWHKNILVLIPKKEENLEELGSWRPISLVNSDVKIFMKILADRLNSICGKLITNGQQGFIKGRQITDAVLDIITTLRNKRNATDLGWLVLIDQAKAFDRVNHTYLEAVLRQMKFGKGFIRIINNLFANQEAHILGKDGISEPFRVERGVRQGDPLSPLLYIIAFEPLLRRIEKNIRGIPLDNFFFKAAAYADDLSVGIGSSSDWEELQKIIKIYESASNAKINKRKTKLLPLTQTTERVELENEKDFNKITEEETVKILGYEVTRDGLAPKNFWPRYITKIKKLIEQYSSRNLSLRGKILVANSLILYRIWYASYICPPNRKQILEINDNIAFWIKRKSKLLPKYSTFQKAYNDFGLQAPIINNLLDARLVTVWKRLMTGNTLWALFQRDTITRLLRNKRNIEVVTALKENPIKLKTWPDEWKPYLKAWRKATGTILASSSWPWEDSMIQIGQWTGAQITVKRVVNLLRDAITIRNNEVESSGEKAIWLHQKEMLNNKKDIMWRLYHKSLPLGYRIRHINENETGDCPWCPGRRQSIEHFAVECKIGKEIWLVAYKFIRREGIQPPSKIEEVFTPTTNIERGDMEAIIWMNIIVIYELWCIYTSYKWGKEPLSNEVATARATSRIRKEVSDLQSRMGKSSKRRAKRFKCIKC